MNERQLLEYLSNTDKVDKHTAVDESSPETKKWLRILVSQGCIHENINGMYMITAGGLARLEELKQIGDNPKRQERNDSCQKAKSEKTHSRKGYKRILFRIIEGIFITVAGGILLLLVANLLRL